MHRHRMVVSVLPGPAYIGPPRLCRGSPISSLIVQNEVGSVRT